MRSDKLMQRIMRFETEKQGEIQPELDQKVVLDFMELVDSMKKPDQASFHTEKVELADPL